MYPWAKEGYIVPGYARIPVVVSRGIDEDGERGTVPWLGLAFGCEVVDGEFYIVALLETALGFGFHEPVLACGCGVIGSGGHAAFFFGFTCFFGV